MEYRLLGSSGCAVSALALGTLTFGNETDQATSFSQLDRFTEAGGNLVDSADAYADGRAEEIIGRWLAARPGRRELVVLATKGRFPTDESPNGHGLSRRHLSLALEASLRRPEHAGRDPRHCLGVGLHIRRHRKVQPLRGGGCGDASDAGEGCPAGPARGQTVPSATRQHLHLSTDVCRASGLAPIARICVPEPKSAKNHETRAWVGRRAFAAGQTQIDAAVPRYPCLAR
jgi:hypothetical protein